jgi:tRNA-dihydrouridine synthase 2
VISYEKSSRQIWSTHPAERPFLIYQIGSSSPSLAVEAALTVAGDVSGVDLNCGCPKPFSTHAGMGANLLTNPDLLCEILTSLRRALPAHIPVTAKIRLLPDQNDTLELIRRIVGTGVSALTVHCRTKEMRKTESALVHRLREIVEFVERLGVGIPVIENGDCLSREDAKRIRDTTGDF